MPLFFLGKSVPLQRRSASATKVVRTVIEGRLTLRAAEGNFVREATGTEDNEIDSWGDPSSNAEAMALRRCCAKFGLGLHLWEK
jgi:hypothetical protein